MSRIIVSVTVLFVFVFAGPHSASAVTWEYQYEGDVLPNNFSPAFALQANTPRGSSTTLNAGGWVDIDAWAAGWYQWDMNSPNFKVGPSGSTIEMRLAVPTIYTQYGTSFQVTDSVVGHWFFTWDATNIYYDGGNQGRPAFTTSAFNTYRFTFEPDGTTKVYLNNDPTPRLTAINTVPIGITNFSIAELTSSAQGVAAYDYLYWTNQGAFAPVPEPTSMALFAIGAILGAFGRLRRLTT